MQEFYDKEGVKYAYEEAGIDAPYVLDNKQMGDVQQATIIYDEYKEEQPSIYVAQCLLSELDERLTREKEWLIDLKGFDLTDEEAAIVARKNQLRAIINPRG